MPNAHPRNAPGSFYVDADCCMTCGIPVETAPEFFMWDDSIKDGPCFVHRQPETLPELVKMAEVLSYQEVDCIRFRGDDADTRRFLVENGHQDRCDPQD
jgi:hypothetical protein